MTADTVLFTIPDWLGMALKICFTLMGAAFIVFSIGIIGFALYDLWEDFKKGWSFSSKLLLAGGLVLFYSLYAIYVTWF